MYNRNRFRFQGHLSAYSDGLEEAAHNGFCDVARASVAAGVLFAAFTATTGAGALGGLAGAALAAHLYATYCGRPMPDPPTGEPQDWTGGQCDGVPYRLAITFALILAPKTSNVNVGRVGVVHQALGPITLAEVYDTGETDNDIRIKAAWKNGSDDRSIVKGNNNDPENPQWGYRDIIIQITREDNQPDLCGDPPPNPPPPPGFDNDQPFSYPTPEGDTINAPVNFNFGPAFIGVGAAVFIPVNIRFSLDPTLNINGTININNGTFSPTFGPPGAPITGDDGPGDVVTPPGTPPPTPPTVPPDPPITPPDPEDTEPPLIIRGVVVTSNVISIPSTLIFQDDIPDIYAPNLGYISFQYRVNDTFAWSHDIPVKNARQLIECPWKYGAINVKGDARPGVTFTLTPIFDYVGYQAP